MFHTVIFFFTILFGVSAYPYGLDASDVGAESVLLKWFTTENNVEEFKVHCSGIRHYMTIQGEPHTELDVLTHYIPGSLTHVLVGDVQANYNYSCTVSEELNSHAQVLGSRVSNPFHFATDYIAPEEPRAPEVNQPDNRPVSIKLFPVSTKYGPILGYKLQFHVVDGQAPDGTPILSDEQTLVPFGMFAPLSQGDAAKSSKPRSFQLSYNNNTLPNSVTIDHTLLTGALKNKAKYSVVTIAYTKSKRQKELKSEEVMFSVSGSSQPFVARGVYTLLKQEAEKFSSSGRTSQLSVAISVGVILPLLVIGWVAFVGVFLLCREHRLRIQQQKAFLRNDIVEAGKLRRTQRHNDMPWIQSPQPMGDLPWLDPDTRSPSQTTEHSRSTPTLHSPSTHDQSPAHRRSSKSLILFSPEIVNDKATDQKTQPNKQMGYTISEPARYDISNIHPLGDQHTPYDTNTECPLPSSEDDRCTYSLQYTTSMKHDHNIRHRSTSVLSNSPPSMLVQSPTLFYSAPDFSSEVSPSDTNLPGAGIQRCQDSNEKIPVNSSSSMFIPRGLSSGPQLIRPGAQPSPIQTLLAQLSGHDSAQLPQQDQAPDLEMDLYDITLT